MPPASSKNIGVAKCDASSRAKMSGRLFGEPGAPSAASVTMRSLLAGVPQRQRRPQAPTAKGPAERSPGAGDSSADRAAQVGRMLFLNRPPQTWMPYYLPRNPQQQREYNLRMQEKFNATRRLPAPEPEPARPLTAKLRALADLRDSGVLSDDEFAAFKAKLLEEGEGAA
jgi:hypothetical protein